MPGVSGKKILLFGDSLSHGQLSPGWFMAKALGDAGATVRINARVGRSAFNFYGRENHLEQIAQAKAWKPDLVIVELGTNDIGLSMAKDGARMVQLRDELAATGATVWAFGPPSFPSGTKEHTGSAPVVQMMHKTFGKRFIDLRPLTADLLSSTHRTSDQIHFTAAGAKIAGQRMAERFEGAHEGSAGVLVGLAAVLIGYYLFR